MAITNILLFIRMHLYTSKLHEKIIMLIFCMCVREYEYVCLVTDLYM